MAARRFWMGACCAALVAGACTTADVADNAPPPSADPLSTMRPVTSAMLHNPSPGDWLQWARTYDAHNFSPLTRINRETVASLQPAWKTPLQDGLSMPTPVVHDGVMFLQTAPDTVLAINAATGAELWRQTYKPANGSTMKMGLALAGGRVFVPTSDLHVLALDAKTGAQVWDHEIAISPPATKRTDFGLRSAPLIVGDKVIQGVTSSGAPGGGYIVGLDINTGKELWRFFTIPRPGEPGGETWNDLPLDKRSGGSVWDQGTYDKDLNLIYFGAAPTYDTGPLLKPSTKPGVNNSALYTDNTIALNPDTGKLVWHYQHLANDQWDLDWVFERQITTMNVGGKSRKVVMTVGKMAILDVLDAKTGEYLFSLDSGVQNIITAIDPKTGAKTTDPAKSPDPNRPALICPGVSGARAWPATSYNKTTGQLFLPATKWCNLFGQNGAHLLSSGVGLGDAEHPLAAADGKMGRLQAMDVTGKKLSWRVDQLAPISTAVMATAGGVVFAGDLDPSLKAFDDRDGKLLWQAPLTNLPTSSLVTYSIGDKQYVAVITGMKNNDVSDLTRKYVNFRKARGVTVTLPKAPPAIEVFALGNR